MPSSQLTFRSACGQFAFVFNNFMLKRALQKAAMRTATFNVRTYADGVTAGLLLSLLFFGNLLILSGDIELNPGPPKTNNSRQTRLTSTGRNSRRCSTDSLPTSENPPPAQQSTSTEPTLKDLMNLLCSMNESWSQPWQTKECTDRKRPAANTTVENVSTEEPTKDFTSVLDSINCKFSEIQQSVENLTRVCKDIQSEISNLKEEMTEIRNEQDEMLKTNALLLDRIDGLEKKTDDLEYKSKRGNLVFHGVERKTNETNMECEQAINKLVTEQLGVDESVQFEKVFRVNSKPDSPIVASFASLQQRDLILTARHKLKGCKVFITEDFPMRIRDIRKKLVPFLKEARRENKRAYMTYDHLVIDGKRLYVGPNGLREKI